MVVSFANQKGGVGKSTLCLSLANYWAARGRPVHVVDTDEQQSLFNLRNDELKNSPSNVPLVEIEGCKLEDFMGQVKQRSQEPGNLLIDLPGGYDKGIAQVILYSDLVIVPFQYEKLVLKSTSMFGLYLDLMEKKFPKFSRTVIYVPNAINFAIGRKEDREYWESWRALMASKALLSPPIQLRACFQRRSTCFMSNAEIECVTPCFEYIEELLFQEQTLIDNQDNK